MKIGYRSSHPSAPWRLIVDRKDRWFATKKEAEAERKRVLAARKKSLPTLSAAQVDEYRHCTELLNGVKLRDAVRFYLNHRPTVDRTMTVNEAISLYLAQRLENPDRVRRDRYVKEMKWHLKALSEGLGTRDLVDVRPADVEAMIEGHTTYVKRDRWRALNRVFRWAKGKRYMIHNPCDDVDQIEDPDVTRRYWQIDEAAKVLEFCKTDSPELVAALAIQLYTGIRLEEIEHLDWSSVGAKRIHLKWTKTGPERVISFWPDNLTKALEGFRQDLGPVAPKRYMHKRSKMFKRSGVAHPQNILRHTYATYGLSLFQSADQIALQMGTSAKLVMKTYAGAVVDREVAAEFFGLTTVPGLQGYDATAGVHLPGPPASATSGVV